MIADPAILDECYRCGYDLRGIADDQPCPECGLLAGRSRRQTDELHNTRPGWLRRLATGIWLLLLAIGMCAAWIPLWQYVRYWQWMYGLPRWIQQWDDHLQFAGYDIAALLLIVGVVLLTSREGYAPADQADRRRRFLLRTLAVMTMVTLGLLHALLAANWPFRLYGTSTKYYRGNYAVYHTPVAYYLEVVGIPLLLSLSLAAAAILLFRHLRSLARRARSAHLAEHCTIVGVGASIALVYVACNYFFFELADRIGLSHDWATRSTVSLIMLTLLGTASMLFLLWALYLLIRFAIAFRHAARQLKQEWKRADRAMEPAPRHS